MHSTYASHVGRGGRSGGGCERGVGAWRGELGPMMGGEGRNEASGQRAGREPPSLPTQPLSKPSRAHPEPAVVIIRSGSVRETVCMRHPPADAVPSRRVLLAKAVPGHGGRADELSRSLQCAAHDERTWRTTRGGVGRVGGGAAGVMVCCYAEAYRSGTEAEPTPTRKYGKLWGDS